METTKKVPWTVQTLRERQPRGRDPRSLSLRQKRADYKSVQKLVDFQSTRENTGQASTDCSKLPTPRPFHTPKPRCNLTQRFTNCSKKLEFTGETGIWESRGLSTWESYSELFRTRKCNLVSMEDVESIFQPKKGPKNLDELMKQSIKSDSGHGESESPPETLEELSDLDLFSDSEDFQAVNNCEIISSDEEDF